MCASSQSHTSPGKTNSAAVYGSHAQATIHKVDLTIRVARFVGEKIRHEWGDIVWLRHVAEWNFVASDTLKLHRSRRGGVQRLGGFHQARRNSHDADSVTGDFDGECTYESF